MISDDVITSMVTHLEQNPGECITVNERFMGSTGQVRFYRDNINWTLPRYLHFRLTGARLPSSVYLRRMCRTRHCQNPRHYKQMVRRVEEEGDAP